MKVFARKFENVPVLVKAAAWFNSFGVAIEGTLSRGILPVILALTVLAWTLELSVFVLVGSALSGGLLVSGGLAAGVLGTLATLVPGVPGHLGTFDFFAAEAFRYSGLSPERAVAAAVLCHIVIVVPVTLYGGFRFVVERRNNG